MENFFRDMDLEGKKLDIVERWHPYTWKTRLTFVFAPMVHWPEVMVTYDSTDKVLFAADGFGKFGALDRDEPWDDEARRYFIGIVGKYGMQVQKLLKVAATLDIQTICSLHGPVLTKIWAITLRNTISGLPTARKKKVLWLPILLFTAIQKKLQRLLADKLKEKGCPKVVVYDLARDDMSAAVEDAFRYGKLVLATMTYNAEHLPVYAGIHREPSDRAQLPEPHHRSD